MVSGPGLCLQDQQLTREHHCFMRTLIDGDYRSISCFPAALCSNCHPWSFKYALARCSIRDSGQCLPPEKVEEFKLLHDDERQAKSWSHAIS